MSSNPRRLGLNARHLDARARTLVPLLQRWWGDWLATVGRELLATGEIEAAKGAADQARITANLRDLLRRHGGTAAADALVQEAGPEMAGRNPAQTLLASDRWAAFEDRVTQSAEARAVDALMAAARRVAADGPLDSSRVLQEAALHPDYNLHTGLARQVLGAADGLGRDQAYDTMGVEFLQWLAFHAPLWPRRHDLLDGVIAARGAGWTMPVSGAHLAFPHDPTAPIGETINCRCTTAPVLPGSEAWRRLEDQGGLVRPPPEVKAPLPDGRPVLQAGGWTFTTQARSAARRDMVLVQMDPRRLLEAYQLDQPEFAVDPGGKNAIPGRLPSARAFLEEARNTGKPVEVPYLVLDPLGRIGVVDGRHRLAVLADLAIREGLDRIPIQVPEADARDLRRRVNRRTR